VELEQARIAVGEASRAMGALMTKYTLILTPTLAYPPPRIGEHNLKPVERAGLAFLRRCGTKKLLRRVLLRLSGEMLEKTSNTMLFNMTGQPAMSVPLWWNGDNLPIGVQFAARFGDEATLFRLASQLEQARPWFDRVPVL
jgi:amidase